METSKIYVLNFVKVETPEFTGENCNVLRKTLVLVLGDPNEILNYINEEDLDRDRDNYVEVVGVFDHKGNLVKEMIDLVSRKIESVCVVDPENERYWKD